MASQQQLNQWLGGDNPDSRFTAIYCDIADSTEIEDAFAASSLIGKLSTLTQYSPRYQGEIIRAMMKRMVALTAPADGLIRAQKMGMYKWRISEKE